MHGLGGWASGSLQGMPGWLPMCTVCVAEGWLLHLPSHDPLPGRGVLTVPEVHWYIATLPLYSPPLPSSQPLLLCHISPIL